MSNSMTHFTFEIASPEQVVLKARMRQVSAPTVMGEITILPSHIPLVALLKPGVIEAVAEDGSREIMAVSGGLIEVMAGKVVVLADTAEKASELDEKRIKEAQERALGLMEQARHQDDVEFARLSALIEKEVARGMAVKRWRAINIK